MTDDQKKRALDLFKVVEMKDDDAPPTERMKTFWWKEVEESGVASVSPLAKSILTQ